MKESLTRDEVKKLLGDLAPELEQVERMTTRAQPVVSMVTPDNTTVWVVRKGAVFQYERHLP